MSFIKDFFNYVRVYSKYVDFTIVITYVLLSLIGLVMIYSASMVTAWKDGGSPESFYIKQLVAIVLGFTIVFIMAYFMSGEFLKNKYFQMIATGSIFILLVYTALFGMEVNGEKNWIPIPGVGFNFQTSEFFKIVTILYLAYIYDRKRDRLKHLEGGHLVPLLFIGFCTMIVITNDFGTGLVIMGIIAGIFLYSGIPIGFLAKAGGVLAVAAGVVGIFTYLIKGSILSPYQQARIDTFLHPFNDPTGTGYQLTNALVSISHGGITGTGIGDSVMKLGYLPEPHTDFIFAIIAEELGLIGVVFILCLYLIIVIKALRYAAISKDMFYRLVCIGVAIYVAFQLFINLGGISKLIPLTGVPLPLLSYGGSSFLSISIAIGLLIIAAKHVKKSKEMGRI
ncbi:FtsW/RodA/SpoVE family cell cycle protein [Salinicoccus sp. ID82-1]|uniref:Probable peptidoglycan glycosyltransferase FtsW n=1 Tax=Salinicoccus cyprini TaxID=2493691 RepID=A0A558AXW2_9STAP|nr:MULTISPECIES: FtsW/RodA/SpoVE family cell cycle protein [Salinicoccus]MCG1008612.1 FtsW/RodA/SpoVE family cell cycle protein [Salinicoccus sp. ID82-1]TVT29090.1 FtsW/RodA/SpoVE family cell cycle protein [Salinicoccus cyprini]